MLRRLKIAALVILPLCMILFILQNRRNVEVTALYATTSVSLAALLLVTILLGFVLGVTVGIRFARPRTKQ